MTSSRRPSQRAARPLALTVVLAVALSAIIYLAVTSLPYLAVSPTTDPAFGALNACLLEAVPERLGFAVSADGLRAAAWSSSRVAECSGSPPVPRVFEQQGVTLGAYDFHGDLWLAGPHEAGPALFHLEAGALITRGHLDAAALVGTARGVAVLDTSGQLSSLDAEGAVLATRGLPVRRDVTLATNADGTLIALLGGDRFAVVDAASLEPTRVEPPCPVTRLWWLRSPTRLVVECPELAVELDAVSGEGSTADARRRVTATLLGAAGLYVQPCDQLPCSAEPPG